MAFLYFMILVYRIQGQLTSILYIPIIGTPTWNLCTFVLQSHMICDVFIFFCSHISHNDTLLPFVNLLDDKLSLNEKMCPKCTEL